MFNFDFVYVKTAELTMEHLAYHYFTNSCIIFSILLIGVGIYGSHKMNYAIKTYAESPKKLKRVKIQYLKFWNLTEMQIFAVSMIMILGAEWIFRSIGLPALHHYSIHDEMAWLRVNTGLSMLTITSFASFIVIHILSRLEYDKEKAEQSENADKISNLISVQKLGWLLTCLVIIDIISIYIFWLSL